jgi:hypothetical protein
MGAKNSSRSPAAAILRPVEEFEAAHPDDALTCLASLLGRPASKQPLTSAPTATYKRPFNGRDN